MYDLARVLDRCKEGGKRVEKRVEGGDKYIRSGNVHRELVYSSYL